MSRTGPNAELGEGIQALARANAKLERMLAKIGTQADTSEFRDRMHSEQSASTKLVKSLMTSLRDANRSQPGGSSVLTRLTTQFDREFKRFQRLNQTMDQKQVKVMDAVKRKRSASQAGAGAYDEEDPLHRPYETAYGQQAQAQEQDLAIQFIEYDVAELEQRQREIGQIEQDVMEVSEMYKDLQVMVHEQQEHIDSIDSYVTQARDKTEAAHQELLAAEEYQRKSRKKKCCVLFLVLVIIGIIIAVVYISK